MKQLFTIACTLVLGSALSFAQTGTALGHPPAGGDTRQNRYLHHHQKASPHGTK